MAIELNHTIVPAHDKVASAKFLARILGLSFDERAVEYFAPVRINDTLTLDFDDDVDHFDIHHYAFHVSDQEFDDILKRVQKQESHSAATRGILRTRSSILGTAAEASTSAIPTAISSSCSRGHPPQRASK